MEKTADKYIRSRDNPGAALNTDNEALKAYKLQKKKAREIDTLKNEVSEIKFILHQLLEKINNK